MAAYAAYVIDNGNGSFTLSKVMRAPTAVTITGGTDLTPPATGGGPVGTTTGLTFTGFLGDAWQRVTEICAADRAYNG